MAAVSPLAFLATVGFPAALEDVDTLAALPPNASESFRFLAKSGLILFVGANKASVFVFCGGNSAFLGRGDSLLLSALGVVLFVACVFFIFDADLSLFLSGTLYSLSSSSGGNVFFGEFIGIRRQAPAPRACQRKRGSLCSTTKSSLKGPRCV